jgi:hypothetical protein
MQREPRHQSRSPGEVVMVRCDTSLTLSHCKYSQGRIPSKAKSKILSAISGTEVLSLEMAGVQSPQRIAGERLLIQLDDAMAHYELSSPICCGGSLEWFYGLGTGTHYGDFTSTRAPVTCSSIAIRWKKGGLSKNTTFDSRSINRPWENTLQELVQDCQPATFGFDGKDILDEKIRKAGKLEAYDFSTNFNPYDYGIVDTVAQELLPGIVRAGKQPAVERWGVVAELYKLNVYSGPSGMFKPHVDTPRGRTQFGSLVVCLPTKFEGNISMPLTNSFQDLLLT